jgi:glucan phosphoethanolaminetransferase (alkaline phosphatase superfamily)
MKAFGTFMKRFLPSFGRPQFIMMAVFAVLNVVFLTVITYKNEFDLGDPLVIASYTGKMFFDIAFVMLAVLLLKAIFRVAWPATVFFVFNILLAIANIIIYYFGNSMLERHHFALISGFSITPYVPVWGLLLVLAIVLFSLWYFHGLIRKIPLKDIWFKPVFYALVMALVTLVSTSGVFTRKNDEKLDRVIMGFRNAQVYYACRNQFLSLVKDVTFPALGEKLKSLSPATESFVDDYNLISDKFKIKDSMSEDAGTIKEWGLPLGPVEYEKLGLEPFTRVIYIFAESASLEALSCYNDKLKVDFATDFFCSEAIQAQTFQNLYTSGSPTLQGLTVTFSSHPNFNIQEQTGQLLSFPKILEKNGFKSVFIRSASKYFANENLVFKNMGFSEVIGREDFYDDESLRKYIFGWGLQDRILYSKAVEYLEKNRGRKVFLSLLGTDTHPPYGQTTYKSLKYPARPQLRAGLDPDIFSWIRSIDYMDYDINNFVKDLDAKGLFDEKTLIVIAADHSSPLNNVVAKIPGHPKSNLAKIPFIVLSKQKLPDMQNDTLASQVDIAPTLFHLMGMKKVPGWWGNSLFQPERHPYSIGFDKGFIRFADGDGEGLILPDKPKNKSEKALIDLFNTVFKPNQTPAVR